MIQISAVNFFPVSQLHDQNEQGLLLDLVNDAMITHPQAINIFFPR